MRGGIFNNSNNKKDNEMTEEELNKELMKLWNEGKTLKDLNMEHKEGDIVGVGGFTDKNRKYYQLCNGEWLPVLLKEKKK